jgi:hypothetical protein
MKRPAIALAHMQMPLLSICRRKKPEADAASARDARGVETERRLIAVGLALKWKSASLSASKAGWFAKTPPSQYRSSLPSTGDGSSTTGK